MSRAINLLQEEFAYVVVDTDAGLGERTLAAIDSATDLVFLCATDVPSVRSLRKELEALDILGMVRQHRHFVLNRADAKVGLSPDRHPGDDQPQDRCVHPELRAPCRSR